MVTYKENERYIFIYKEQVIIAVLRRKDNIIEFGNCTLTVEEFKQMAELFL